MIRFSQIYLNYILYVHEAINNVHDQHRISSHFCEMIMVLSDIHIWRIDIYSLIKWQKSIINIVILKIFNS